MSGWGGGYVTDIPYSVGWYRNQSPVRIALASIIGGAEAHIPNGDDPVMMLELGCGFGYTAMALAASNPTWTVFGVDFNPAHIAAARDWAVEAGLTNVTFIEADFSRWEDNPALRDLPGMDFVTMHGIWSWIPPAAKTGIVRLLGAKVRPGGLVHLSYNAMTGWIDMLPAANLIREAGNRAGGASDHRAAEGLRLVRDLIKAEAHNLHGRPAVTSRMEMFENASANYLAHEFMNDHWAPCFVNDVATALSEAKLEWVAASELTENFPELVMSEAQREIFHRYPDRMMQELVKDICTPRALRQDVFVRGATRIRPSERTALLMDVSLTLTKPAEDLPESLNVAAGKAELNKAFYGPIVRALATRPWRVGDLLALPNVVGKRDNPAELIAILTGADMVEPTLRPMTPPGPDAMRFNEVSARRMIRKGSPNGMLAIACRPTGMPLATPLLGLVLLYHYRNGITGVEGLIQAIEPDEDKLTEARTVIVAFLDRHLPAWKNAGAL
ncbi:MAG: methyltransferase domain-containing protein [Acetobacteraceae bacterium]|nr:methyltransferase domain-containing protein [Acetobacteraceae bacterium]